VPFAAELAEQMASYLPGEFHEIYSPDGNGYTADLVPLNSASNALCLRYIDRPGSYLFARFNPLTFDGSAPEFILAHGPATLYFGDDQYTYSSYTFTVHYGFGVFVTNVEPGAYDSDAWGHLVHVRRLQFFVLFQFFEQCVHRLFPTSIPYPCSPYSFSHKKITRKLK
jgi:hypothetical protein